MASKKCDSQETGEIDLDYHVTFPPPLPKVDENSSESFEPVVILLGWAGCEDRHLQKYSSIYDKSCITVRYTAPMKDLFTRSGNLLVNAACVLDVLEELNLDENPLFIHCFSNGGASIYCNMLQLIQTKPKYSNVKFAGVIFDSAPAEHKIPIAMRALSASLPYHPIINKIIAVFFGLYLMILNIFSLISQSFGARRRQIITFDAVMSDPNRCPQLFLYSKGDKITRYEGIDQVVAERRGLGVNVQSVCWENSNHIQHLRKHREAYIMTCLNFLTSSLKEDFAQKFSSQL